MDGNINFKQQRFLLIVVVIISTLLLFGIIIIDTHISLTKPEIYTTVNFQDIAYNDDYNSYPELMFMDVDGGNITKSNISFSAWNSLSILGEKIYWRFPIKVSKFLNIMWSPDGKALGVAYSDPISGFWRPALIMDDGEVLTCLQDNNLAFKYYSQIQVLNDERIIVNGKDRNNPNYDRYDIETFYLVLYNMRSCREEAVYYASEVWHNFAISSKNWLAICERIDGSVVTQVYDENRDLVNLPNADKSNYFLIWSNDGNKLLYEINSEKGNGLPAIFNFETGELTEIDKFIFQASFSPDGEKLIAQLHSGKIVILDLNTMEETYVDDGSNPAWRP